MILKDSIFKMKEEDLINDMGAESLGDLMQVTDDFIDDDEQEEFQEGKQYCVFQAGKEYYAISISSVKEIIAIPPIAKLPQVPSHIIGMSNVRGNIYGVMDLALFFQGENKDEKFKYLLVLDDDVFKMSIRITEVPNTITVLDDEIEKIRGASNRTKKEKKYLQGIIKQDNKMIVLFDVIDMIASDHFAELME